MLVITGGTGFVGSRIGVLAARQGERVRVLARQAKLPHELAAAGVEVVRGDVRDIDSLSRAFGGASAVLHLVGIIVERPGAGFDEIHFRGTENALAAAREAGVRRFVHMSALGTRPKAGSRYHRSKWAAEVAVRQSGLDWTIHRPSVVYGSGDGFVSRFARMIRWSPVVPVPGDGTNRLQPIWVEDVAACFVQSLEKPETVGRTFELGGPRPLTLDDVLDRLMEVLRKRRLRVHLPISLLHASAALLESTLPTPPLTRDQLLMLREENVCDPAPMRETFRVALLEFEEGLRRVLR